MVKVSVLRLEIRHEWIERERFPRHARDQAIRGKGPSPAVDVFIEPDFHGREIAGGNKLRHVGNVFFCAVEKLYGVEVAEGVRRKIANRPERPVDILQDTYAI